MEYDQSLDRYARDAAAARPEERHIHFDKIRRMLDGYGSVDCIGRYLKVRQPAERILAVLKTILYGLKDNEPVQIAPGFFGRHASDLNWYLKEAKPIWRDNPDVRRMIKKVRQKLKKKVRGTL